MEVLKRQDYLKQLSRRVSRFSECLRRNLGGYSWPVEGLWRE